MNSYSNPLFRTLQVCAIVLWATFIVASTQAQTPATGNLSPASKASKPKPMAVPNPQVEGSGTIGHLTKWFGFNSSNSFITDSVIFEDKFGKIGIGTTTPTSLLTVKGMIETQLGGYKFPDGTIQTTAAVGGLQFVFTDSTLRGDGTSGFPLGVAIPLTLSADRGSEFILTVRNIGERGNGIQVSAGFSSSGVGGTAIDATGGDSEEFGGNGVDTKGGFGDVRSGDGVRATGGNSEGGLGGNGVTGIGGDSNNNSGGFGASLFGGLGSGAGHAGGIGLFATGGAGADGATNGLAAQFSGDVAVSGNLSKGGGSFKIDHPLDPENKYLYHSFVESPDMKNIYDGIAKLDSKGEATVQLPEWFGALNKDFRYLLTAIGSPSPALYIAEEISDNRFKIAGGTPGMKVSWQVTGIRQDAYANKHRIQVEEAKPGSERGTYLHPDAFDQPEERGVEWARNPEMMRQMKARREQTGRKTQNNHP